MLCCCALCQRFLHLCIRIARLYGREGIVELCAYVNGHIYKDLSRGTHFAIAIIISLLFWEKNQPHFAWNKHKVPFFVCFCLFDLGFGDIYKDLSRGTHFAIAIIISLLFWEKNQPHFAWNKHKVPFFFLYFCLFDLGFGHIYKDLLHGTHSDMKNN